MAPGDGFAHAHFLVAILEGRVQRCVRPLSTRYVRVHGTIELLEGVGKALVVPTGIVGEGPHCRLQESWIAQQRLISLVAPAKPEFVGPFAVPGQGRLAAGDLVAQTILAARCHLRHRERARRPAAEAQQNRAVVLGVDGNRLRLPGPAQFAAERLDATLGPLPRRQEPRETP